MTDWTGRPEEKVRKMKESGYNSDCNTSKNTSSLSVLQGISIISMATKQLTLKQAFDVKEKWKKI